MSTQTQTLYYQAGFGSDQKLHHSNLIICVQGGGKKEIGNLCFLIFEKKKKAFIESKSISFASKDY